MRPALVIFDCDGVLLDSEALSARAWSLALADCGLDYGEAELARRFTGYTDAMMTEIIGRERGAPLPGDMTRRVLDRSLRLFAEELRPIEGIVELLGRLQTPRCVASNSGVERLRESLRLAGLAPLFAPEAVFSAEQVARPKPAPDLHLHAARSLGFAPADCLVIEDSATGVAAARAAGIPVVGFLGAAHLPPNQAESLLEAGAERVVADAAALGELLGV